MSRPRSRRGKPPWFTPPPVGWAPCSFSSSATWCPGLRHRLHPRQARISFVPSEPRPFPTAPLCGASSMDATNGRGADAVFDSIGQATRAESFAVLGRYGHLAYFGESSGPPAPIHPDELYGRCLRVSSFWLAADPPERWNAARRDLQDWVVDGTLRITVGQTFPLHEAPEAHRQLESRETHGKLILVPAARSAHDDALPGLPRTGAFLGSGHTDARATSVGRARGLHGSIVRARSDRPRRAVRQLQPESGGRRGSELRGSARRVSGRPVDRRRNPRRSRRDRVDYLLDSRRPR